MNEFVIFCIVKVVKKNSIISCRNDKISFLVDDLSLPIVKPFKIVLNHKMKKKMVRYLY